MQIALSSCWNAHRHTDGYAMVAEAVELGFHDIELSHGIRVSLLPGILKAAGEGLATFGSVHNFCPLPAGVFNAAPNIYQPTGGSRQEQGMWLRNTARTLDFARHVGATLMVIHSGSVRFWWRDPEATLERYRAGKSAADLAADPAYPKVLRACLERVRRGQKQPRARLLANFRQLVPLARERGVRIGIENREGLDELPMDLEMAGLLAELGEEDVFFYWHDAGHAQLKEQLGIMPHRELLVENAARLAGFHLHDVSAAGRDHQPVGSGVIDWAMLRGFIRPGHRLVLELSPSLSAEKVGQSRDFIENLLARET
jgi:sugar phosphate isomerase/epimerase